jgi:predicted nuclease of restriction endonuclease-like (RecB) superfamily
MKKPLPTKKTGTSLARRPDPYANFAGKIAGLLDEARRQAARSVNAIMTATYWEIGRRIVEFEQKGKRRAEYGEELLIRLSQDLTAKFGRGFSVRNPRSFRAFYLEWQIRQSVTAESAAEISASPTRKSLLAPIPQTPSAKFQSATFFQTPSEKSQTRPGKSEGEREPKKYATRSRKSSPSPIVQTLSAQSTGDYLAMLAQGFPLSWTHYVRLLSVKTPEARAFYEAEALRGGWSVQQLDRQIGSLFYERTALSKDKAAMLVKGAKPKPEDVVTVEEQIKDPYVLEFLGLKDEYSESQLEEALIRHLESFLLELGNEFTFVGRQKRIRVGDSWYRMDLLVYHRRLRCLVIIDLKVGKFTHADAGQMNLYVNYAWEHLTLPDENPPVGLVLCSERDSAVAHYALGNMLNKVMAAEYRLALPDTKQLEEEIEKTRQMLQSPAREILKRRR